MPELMPSLPNSFIRKKVKILADLAVPVESYDDLSPKGSVDVGIRDLIDEINELDGFITTSSCAGRVSVFLEGQKKGSVPAGSMSRPGDEEGEHEKEVIEDGLEKEEDNLQSQFSSLNPAKLAATGGKGGGGRWLYVSHDPTDLEAARTEVARFLGMDGRGDIESGHRSFENERLIHFKFEPMILHILTATFSYAQIILSAALQAGFRESGAQGLISFSTKNPTPMVAVRSMGLSLESVIGRLGPNDETVCIVPESYLNGLLSIANERFEENTRRIARFRALLKTGIQAHVQSNGSVPKKTKENGEEWEDTAARKERKRAEGLARAAEKRAQSEKKGVMLSPSVSDLPLESNLIKEGSEANH